MKKNLLTESEIRKFMKFANFNGSVTDNFVETIQEEWSGKKDDDLEHDEPGGRGHREGDKGYKNEEVVSGEDVVTEEEVTEEEDVVTEEEVTEEEEITEEVLTEDDVDVKELVRKLMQVISDETGVEAEVVEDEVEVGDEVEVEDEVEVGDEGAEEFVGDELEAGDMGDMAPEEDEVEDIEDLEVTEESTPPVLAEMDDLVDEVTKRVAERLLNR